MKQNRRDRVTNVLVLISLAASFGLVFWQGIRHFSKGNAEGSSYEVRELTTDVSIIITNRNTEETASETALSGKTSVRTEKTSTVSATKKTASEKSGTVKAAAETAAAAEIVFPLELNAATAEELEALPGIGTVLAERIIAYRTQIGGFLNRDQLLEVEGIGEVTLAEIYDLIYLTEEVFSTETTERAVRTTDSETQTVPITTAEVYTETENTETEAEIETDSEASEVSFPLEMNSMDREELLLVPGMTEELADEILALREEITYFSSVYELLYAESMTSMAFDVLREYFYVEDVEVS